MILLNISETESKNEKIYYKKKKKIYGTMNRTRIVDTGGTNPCTLQIDNGKVR